MRSALLNAVTLLMVVLATSVSAAGSRPKRLLIVGQGPDGHPPTTHEFMAGAKVLAELLKPYQDLQATVVNADEPWADGPRLIDQADGLVMLVTQGAQWMQSEPQRHDALKRYSRENLQRRRRRHQRELSDAFHAAH